MLQEEVLTFRVDRGPPISWGDPGIPDLYGASGMKRELPVAGTAMALPVGRWTTAKAHSLPAA